MALIVSTTHTTVERGMLKAKCDTIIFENEEQGREFIEDNKTFVYSVQKAHIVKEKQDNDYN